MKSITVLALTTVVLLLSIVAALSFGAVGFYRVYRHETEPLAEAEKACYHLIPEDASDSPARWRCLKREMAESTLQASGHLLTWSVIAAVIAVAAGAALRLQMHHGSAQSTPIRSRAGP